MGWEQITWNLLGRMGMSYKVLGVRGAGKGVIAGAMKTLVVIAASAAVIDIAVVCGSLCARCCTNMYSEVQVVVLIVRVKDNE